MRSPSLLLILVGVAALASLPAWSLTGADGAGDSVRTRNVLRGVVVSATTGEPVEGAQVAMAHRSRGLIFLDAEKGLSLRGWDDRTFFFFTKRNGAATVEARSDAEGRFVLDNFMDAGHSHALVVLHPERGAAYLERIRPADHRGGELRIALEPAARLCFPLAGIDGIEGARAHYSLSVQNRTSTPEGEPNNPPNLRIRLGRVESEGVDEACSGPLPPGDAYTLFRTAHHEKWGYAPTLLARRLTLQPGQRLEVPVVAEGGAIVEGRVTGSDGAGLPLVNVVLFPEEPGLWKLGAVTDESGRFSLRGVPPGEHAVKLERFAPRTAPG